MIQPDPQPETLIVIGIFLVSYILLLVRKTLQAKLDLYDLFHLSMVAVLPAAFVFFPRLAYAASDLTGVAFPFVLLYGSLFLVVFIFMHRLSVQNHRLQQRTRVLVQELGLLREEMLRTKDPVSAPARGE